MESSSFHDLPPFKRFKLLHAHEDHNHNNQHNPATIPLCLPAKKRIWAPQSLSPVKFLLDPKPTIAIDLNLRPTTDNNETKSKEEQEEEEGGRGGGEADVAEEEDDDGVICAVCGSTDGDSINPIVFCDGCDLMVHAQCYGDPLINSIPDGEWFCHVCITKSTKEIVAPDCCLCPANGGALKPTTDGRWAHIRCALLVPEVFFKNPNGRETIDCSKVPLSRWNKACYLCGSNNGCALECSEPKCELGFHVSCGIEEDLSIEFREGRGGGVVAGFCKPHTELWKKQQLSGKFKIVPRNSGSKRRS